MNSFDTVGGTLEELITELCEETLSSIANEEADAAAANFLTRIIQAQPISKTWH